MESNSCREADDRADEAVAARLAKLRAMPVDTSRLEAALRSQIPSPADARPLFLGRWTSWLRPLRVAAAALLLLAVVAAALLSTSGGPALASAAQMARMHEDLISGKTPVMKVDSIEAANRALAAQSPRSPPVPALPSMPADHVMACCMKSVKGKRVACVVLKDAGVPITMTVASAADLRAPASPAVTRGGVTYHVQSHDSPAGTLNMVMTERGGRWVCLIGRLPADRLMDIAAKLTF